MTRDRLAALKATLSDDDDEYEIPEPASPLDGLFQRCDSIRLSVDHIRSTIEQVKRKHDDILCSVSNDEQMKDELEEMMDEVKKSSQKVRVKLKQLKTEVPEDENPTTAKIRTTQIQSLEMAFVKLMGEYHTDQEKYMERYKDKLRRPFEILGKEVSDSELDEMVTQKNVKIFFPDIIETQKMRQAVADIEARHAEIIKLEKSIMELHDMFVEMSTLIEHQGELVDRIEYNVEMAVENVESGKKDMGKATIFYNKYKKKQLMIIICVLVMVGILVAILLSFV